MEFANTITLIF